MFAAYLRDITSRSRAERRREVRLAVAQVLSEATSVRSAALGLLEAVCQSLGWEAGIVWTAERENQVLRGVSVWTMLPRQPDQFWDRSPRQTFAPGECLLGRVWSNGTPEWISDIEEASGFLRRDWAVDEGLRSAPAFPIMIGSEVLGVMEFFSSRVREPESDLLEALATIGNQIGGLIARKQAEQAVRESEARFRVMADSAPVLLRVLRADGQCTFFNRSWLEFTGRPLESAMGEGWLKDVRPEDREAYLRALHQAISRQREFRLEYRLRRSDGAYRWVLDSAVRG